jgi:hypothetical protein
MSGPVTVNNQIIIDGDIVPRTPTLKPEDVIRVVIADADRTSTTGVGGAIQRVIKRNR